MSQALTNARTWIAMLVNIHQSTEPHHMVKDKRLVPIKNIDIKIISPKTNLFWIGLFTILFANYTHNHDSLDLSTV